MKNGGNVGEVNQGNRESSKIELELARCVAVEQSWLQMGNNGSEIESKQF